MLKQQNITKPIQILQYKGSEPILLVPDYVVENNIDINNATLSVHIGGVVLLTAQDNEFENGMYKYTGSSLTQYYFDFFNNIKKLYKVTQDSSYIVYNGPTDPFNQFDTIKPEDTLIAVQKQGTVLPYQWYNYEQNLEPKIRLNKEIIKNNFCALGIVYNDKTSAITLDLNQLPNQPLVFTSEIYNCSTDSSYTVVTDLVQSPDIDYQSLLVYSLEEGSDFTIDSKGNLILSQSLVSNGLNGIGKLKNWQPLYAIDKNFLNNYLLQITSKNNVSKIYFYNQGLDNPYSNLSQDLVKYPFSVHPNSDNIVFDRRYLLQNNIVTIAGLESSTFINSSIYASRPGAYEVRVRLLDSSFTLVGEDRFSFDIQQVVNLPTPTPTPTPSAKKHTVVFDAGPILAIDNCEDCYKDFLTATVSNMSEESRYYYEFGVFAYGNPNPDEPRDITNSDDISFTTASGILNNGLTTENIKTLITTGIGKIRTTLYIKVINLDNYITSTSYITLEKCNRDFCVVTPTPTSSKALKSYPPRTPTKTKTPTPTVTSTKTPTPTPTPTTPLLPPGTPTNLSGVAGNTSVSLSWTAPTNSIIRDYIIQYSSNSGSTWTTFSDGTSTSTTATVTGLTNGTSYLFRVAATNGAGSSSYISLSNPLTPIANAPYAPTITSVVSGDTTITLNWIALLNGGATITDYVVDYSSNVGATWTTFNHSPSPNTSIVVTGLTNGTSYIFRVAAINSTGTGQYSLYSTAGIPATLPGSPTGLTAVLSGSNINLAWTAPANNGGAAITDYTIQYSSNSGSSWTTYNDGVSTSNTNIISGLSLGSTYIFRVSATNRAGTGSYSSSSSGILLATAPSAPTSLSASILNTSVIVTWNTPTNNGSSILDYTIQSSSDNGLSWTTISSNATGNNITISSPNVVVGYSYIFRVAARNSIGLGSYITSNVVTIYSQGQALAFGLNNNSQIGDGLYQSKCNVEPISKPWAVIDVYYYDVTNYAAAAINTSGELYAWGRNSSGLNADGTVTPYYSPKKVGLASNWVSVSIGYSSAYAINSLGELYSWGSNNYGELGTGGSYSYTPVKIGTANNWVKVSVGNYSVAAINTLGELYTWGYNNYGQLGNGTNINNAVPNKIGISYRWSHVGVGDYHMVGITTSGEMYSWGFGGTGQLGDGTYTGKSTPTRIGTASNWVKVVCGPNHNLAINSNNQLFGWGDNIYGQLGDGTTVPRSTPVQAGSSSNWSSNYFTTGYYHSMAINSLGELYTWGYNNFGQLGDGTNTNKTVTNKIANLTSYSCVSAGYFSSWIIKDNGNLYSAGYTPYTAQTSGQIFNRLGSDVNITNATNIVQIAAGDTFSTIINNYGQHYVTTVQAASSSVYANAGFTLTPLNGVKSISASNRGDYYLAIDSSNNLYGAGNNSYYQMGVGNFTNKFSPSLILSYSTSGIGGGIKKISAGAFHSLFIGMNNTLWACGYNTYGGLGIAGANTLTSFTQVGTSNNWIEIAASVYFSAAINSLGELYAWGYNNYGQLGTGDTTNLYIPTKVGVSSNWIKVVAGDEFILALNSSGELWACGNNTSGQLGLGNISYSFSMARVGSASNWVSIEAGSQSAFAINTNKELYGWGANSGCQLADGSLLNKNTPTRIGSGYSWLAVSASQYHTLGIVQ